MLTTLRCPWCDKEWNIPDISNAVKMGEYGLLWCCPLCDKYTCTVDKDLMDDLNAAGRLIVEGR